MSRATRQPDPFADPARLAEAVAWVELLARVHDPAARRPARKILRTARGVARQLLRTGEAIRARLARTLAADTFKHCPAAPAPDTAEVPRRDPARVPEVGPAGAVRDGQAP